MQNKPTHNPHLKFIKNDWSGNTITDNGQYQNLDGTSLRTMGEVWKWMSNERPLTKLKKGQQSSLSFSFTDNIADKSIDGLIPIGHAGFVLDMGGLRIVIDPLLYPNSFLKRFTPAPFSGDDLTGIDYLILSHNHRDHIDKQTVKKLTALNPNCKILTGLETGKLLKKWSIKNEIEEAGWYQRYNTIPDVEIDYLPSKHWSRRWLSDTNINLWGSYMIHFTKQNKTLYFGSDSGYGIHFDIIGKMYNIDLALIGIGAYEPMWFMHTGHTGPADALKAFNDLNAKTLMPMHYGTLDISDEPIFYPEKLLRELLNGQPIDVRWMELGQRMTW
jgi:L-ascorbate metabolism protein UlaG (beta-lactamase superfamily)